MSSSVLSLSLSLIFIEVWLIYHAVNSCYTAKGFSYTYVYILFFFNILFRYGLSQDFWRLIALQCCVPSFFFLKDRESGNLSTKS